MGLTQASWTRAFLVFVQFFTGLRYFASADSDHHAARPGDKVEKHRSQACNYGGRKTPYLCMDVLYAGARFGGGAEETARGTDLSTRSRQIALTRCSDLHIPALG